MTALAFRCRTALMLQEQDAERSANSAAAFSQDWLLAISPLAQRQLEVRNPLFHSPGPQK
jgi:hypothetical protein